MAQDVVVNGTTYPAVESVALRDGNGNVTQYYPDAVRYVEQSLTPEQKAQARQNIGAISEDEIPSNAIIDVTELPTENIEEGMFYRLLTGRLVFSQLVQNMYTCYCVESLPEAGEPATNLDQTEGNVYYVVGEGELYGYVDSMLSMGLGVPAGWYPAATLLGALGYEYAGVITNIMDDPGDNKFRFLLEYVIYSHKDSWTSHKALGWAGTGMSAEIFNSLSNKASGVNSHAEGDSSHAEGNYSHAEGNYSHAEGDYSHAEGKYSHAEGDSSHAEGKYSHAEGDYSHAEGISSHAKGYCSHAEGNSSHAEGDSSHAEGDSSHAEGDASHAEGRYTHAVGRSQHAQGEYNIVDPEYDATDSTKRGKYAHIVGNGTDIDKRSNAHTLDWSGNAWYQGEVYVGGTDQDHESTRLMKVTELPEAINTALAQAKASGEFNGSKGESYADTLALPSYYDDYIPGKIAQVKALMDEAGADGTAFVMFSDSHMELKGSGVNGGNSGKIAYKILNECQIPFALHFGDAGSNSPQETEELCVESLEAFNTMVKPLEGRLFQILGNHDGAWGLPVDTNGDGETDTYPYNMTRGEVFNRALQKNRLSPRMVDSPDGGYYYIDDAGSRTRFLMLNTSDKPYETNDNGTMVDASNTMKDFAIRQAQIDWIINALNVPDGWHVVSCSHAQLHPDMLESSEHIRGLLAAYRDKTTYTATYAGQHGSTGSGGYINLFDASGEGYSLSGTTMFTNRISVTYGNIVHIKSSNNRTPYKVYMYDSTGTSLNSAYFSNSVKHGTADYDETVLTYVAGTKNTNGDFYSYDDFASVSFEFRNTVPTDLVITVNENIEGAPAGSGGGTNWDALTINADFSDYYGEYIAHFCGHAHNDNWWKQAGYLIDMVSIACDGRIGKTGYMEDATYENRALGTIYEQVLDVVVVNKAARTIKTVRFGAGENREITYPASVVNEGTDDESEKNIVPDYWLSELEEKADAIQIAMEKAGRNKSAFLWYTDAHWPMSSKMSPVLLDYLCKHTPMNRVNFGGDIIGDPSAYTHENIKYAYEWREMVSDIPNHHSIFGNHDVNHNSGGAETRNMAYSFLIASEESSDMVMGDGAYYYIDNNSEKTRYLYLEYLTSDHNAMMAQGAFIVDAIKSVPEGWHIVVINHRWWQYSSASAPTVGSVPAYEAEILSVFDAYNARTSRAGSNYFYEQDFADCKGKVEFCIGGHIHVDYDFTTDGGIPVIITAPDTNQERSSDETEDCGTAGTITESAVYGIIADYTDSENTVITIVGVGRGGSRIVGSSGSAEPVNLFNLNRTYVAGTTDEYIRDYLDESKAYTNVAYSTTAFNAKACTVSDISDDSVTVTESGVGGVTVAYAIYLPDITKDAYRLTFDYSGTGKCRVYYRYGISGVLSGSNTLFTNDTSGASGSADVTIPANTDGYTWLIIMLGSNTSGLKSYSNVALTKA